jgi:hypothetical protein
MAAHGGRAKTPQSVLLNAFEANAQVLAVSPSDQSINTVAQQGAGALQAYDAYHAAVEVNPTELLLNDTVYLKDKHTLTIKNTGKSKTKFQFTHLAVDTIYSKMQVRSLPYQNPDGYS